MGITLNITEQSEHRDLNTPQPWRMLPLFLCRDGGWWLRTPKIPKSKCQTSNPGWHRVVPCYSPIISHYMPSILDIQKNKLVKSLTCWNLGDSCGPWLWMCARSCCQTVGTPVESCTRQSIIICSIFPGEPRCSRWIANRVVVNLKLIIESIYIDTSLYNIIYMCVWYV